LVILRNEDKIRDIQQLDKLIRADIPDKETEKELFDIVTSHNIHGPCGMANPLCPCMDESTKKCSKDFPKDYNEKTEFNVNGYSLYKRPRDGNYVIKKGKYNQDVKVFNIYY
jgi:hypothetical protein